MHRTRTAAWILAAACGAALAGCQSEAPGRTRQLGAVSYEAAFSAAREVLATYYPLDEWDADTGVIQSLPKDVSLKPDRMLGQSETRQVATIRVRKQKDDTVVAQASVAVQQQQRYVQRTMRPVGENYDEVPNTSPAQLDAATTAEQNDQWETHSYDHQAEARILDDIYQALHPQTH